MNIRKRFLLVILITSCVRAFSQAPTTLSGFTNQVLSLNFTGGTSVSAIRLFANGTLIISGNNLGLPTAATYTNLSAAGGLLTLSGSGFSNQLTLNFATATTGPFTNIGAYTGMTAQSSTGTFALTPGTNVPPVIYYNTPGLIVQSNNAATYYLAVSVSGFADSYYWQQNGAPYTGSGANTQNIPFIHSQPSNTGSYTCIVSNSAGMVTSAVMTVTLAQPITFSQQPQGREILEGSYLALSVAFTGDYQNVFWYRGAANVASGLSPSYIVPSVLAANAGNYYALIDNYGTNVASQVAPIIVRRAGTNVTWLTRPFVKIADDRMIVPGFTNHHFTNWLAGQNTPLITFRNFQVYFVAGTTAGVRSLFGWTNGLLSTLVFTNTPRLSGGFYADVYYPTDAGNGIVNFTDNAAGAQGMGAYSAAGVSNVFTVAATVPGRTNLFAVPGSYGRRNGGVAIGSAIVKSPANSAGIFFHDGTNLTRICDETTPLPGGVSGYGFRPTANSVNFDGANLVFSTSGASNNLGGFYKATPAGVITRLADSFTLRPGSATLAFTNFSDVDVDGGLVFAVANNVVYKFEADNTVTNLASGAYVSAAGARAAYYGTVSMLSRWNDGLIQTVLTAGQLVDGRVVSQILGADGQGDDIAVLLKFSDNSEGIYIVYGPQLLTAGIASPPLDFNAVDNGNAAFYVSADGPGPFTFQWLKDSQLLPDRTNFSLTFTNVHAADAAGYSVVVTDAAGSVTSATAQLTVTIPSIPIILGNVTQVGSAFYGSNVSYTVTASGAAPLTYTWLRGSNPIAGATGPRLDLHNLSDADYAFYSVVISNANGSVTGGNLRPAINTSFATQPLSQTVSVGASVTFSVNAQGVSPVTYQWQKLNPFVNLADATNTSITLTNLAAGDAGMYRVLVSSGSINSTASDIATLTVSTNTAPMLTAPALIAGKLQFNIPTQSGYNYLLLSKTNLADAAWILEQTIPGDGAVKPISLNPTNRQQFFRVQVQ